MKLMIIGGNYYYDRNDLDKKRYASPDEIIEHMSLNPENCLKFNNHQERKAFEKKNGYQHCLKILANVLRYSKEEAICYGKILQGDDTNE